MHTNKQKLIILRRINEECGFVYVKSKAKNNVIYNVRILPERIIEMKRDVCECALLTSTPTPVSNRLFQPAWSGLGIF